MLLQVAASPGIMDQSLCGSTSLAKAGNLHSALRMHQWMQEAWLGPHMKVLFPPSV